MEACEVATGAPCSSEMGILIKHGSQDAKNQVQPGYGGTRQLIIHPCKSQRASATALGFRH